MDIFENVLVTFLNPDIIIQYFTYLETFFFDKTFETYLLIPSVTIINKT